MRSDKVGVGGNTRKETAGTGEGVCGGSWGGGRGGFRSSVILEKRTGRRKDKGRDSGKGPIVKDNFKVLGHKYVLKSGSWSYLHCNRPRFMLWRGGM